MTATECQAGSWIPWFGGDCPVLPGTPVQIRLGIEESFDEDQPASIARQQESGVVLAGLPLHLRDSLVGNPRGAGVGHILMQHHAAFVRQIEWPGRVRVGQVSGQHFGHVRRKGLHVLTPTLAVCRLHRRRRRVRVKAEARPRQGPNLVAPQA